MLGIYGLNWCDHLFLIFWFHPWYMMHWMKWICFILSLWWFSSKYTESMTCWLMASPNRRWNRYGTFFETLDAMVIKHGQFISCWTFSAFDISVFDVMLYYSCWDFFSQLVLLWIVCLRSPPIHSIIWPDRSGMMKKVCYDQTFIFSAGWLLIQAWSLFCLCAEK